MAMTWVKIGNLKGPKGDQGPQGAPGDVSAWKASTAYLAGQTVVSPSGDLVTAKAGFTSGASYDAANWNASTFNGRIGAVETKNTAQDGRLDVVEGVASRAVPSWKPNTAYAAGQAVVNPSGELVTARVAFTSDATYSKANWNTDQRLPQYTAEEGWRVRDRTGSSALGVNPAGNTLIGQAEVRQLPDGSQYKFLIRDKSGAVALGIKADGTGATGGSGTVTEVHAFVAAGQSNMSGRGTPYGAEYDPTDPRIFQYGSKLNTAGTITAATVPLDMHDAAGGLSPATVFAREYLKDQPANVGVLLIPAAHGGTAFMTSSEVPLPAGYAPPNAGGGTWQYNRSEPVNLYQIMVAQTTAALTASASQLGVTAVLKGFLWHQGEGDAGRATQAEYAGYFDAMVADFRSRFGASIPVVLGGMSPDAMAETPTMATIHAAHLATPARLQRAGFARAEPDTGKYGDNIHFGREGVEIVGANMVDAYRVALANTTSSSPMPPRNARATFIGGILTATWDYPLSRATAFVLEYSIDGGAWTPVTRATPMDYRETVTGLTGAVARVRVSTVNEVGTSAPSTPVTALGA